MSADLETFAQGLLLQLCRDFPMGYTPTLTWRNLRVTAGLAMYQKQEIVLSRLVLTDAERLRITLIHEYAHLLAFKRLGRKGAGHGKAWREAMVELGLPPTVQHNYPVQRNAKRQSVVYRCVRCGSQLTRARILPKRRKYVHARCGGALKLEAIERIEAA